MAMNAAIICCIINVGQGSCRDSSRLAESLWGMGGTLVNDECHLFDW